MEKIFIINGMSCSSCSLKIEKSVLKIDEIKSCNINLVSKKMTINYEGGNRTVNKVISTVSSLGYDIKVEEVSGDNNDKNDEEIKESNNFKNRLILSSLFLLPLFYISMGSMLNMPIPSFLNISNHPFHHALFQLLLTIPIIIVNHKFFTNGFKHIIKFSPNMNSLISLGSLCAFIYSIINTYKAFHFSLNNNNILAISYAHNLYYESCAMILTLVTLGKFLESKAMKKTMSAIKKLINLTPKTAKLIDPIHGEKIINTADIKINNILKVNPGDFIPADGIILSGSTSIIEAAITGESLPVDKNVGDFVICGTINKTGTILIRARKNSNDTTISNIIKLVKEASSSKAKISKIADKICTIFVPLIVLIAITTFIIWYALTRDINNSILHTISVLVVSCPCALGLAAPVAIIVGTGKSYENGILVKSAQSLELMSKINSIVLDKTGTITEGIPKILDIKCFNNYSFSELLNICYGIESLSNHPFACAIVEYCKKNGAQKINFKTSEIIEGIGIKCCNKNNTYYAGNYRLLKRLEINNSIYEDKSYTGNNSNIYIIKNKRLIAIITLGDVIKSESRIFIDELKKLNINPILLSGDSFNSTKKVADSLGISSFISEVYPEDKYQKVNELQNSGQLISMIGDGINDAPAIIKSDVGISIANGTDIAIDSADVILINNNLMDIIKFYLISKKTLKIIKENFFWAFIYNILCIPIAAGLFSKYGINFNPMLASACMSLSSIFVVFNALRIKNLKFNNFSSCSNNKVIPIMEDTIIKTTLIVHGMKCQHCKQNVEKIAQNFDEVVSANVNLSTSTLEISYKSNVIIEDIKESIQNAGYKID